VDKEEEVGLVLLLDFGESGVVGAPVGMLEVRLEEVAFGDVGSAAGSDKLTPSQPRPNPRSEKKKSAAPTPARIRSVQSQSLSTPTPVYNSQFAFQMVIGSQAGGRHGGAESQPGACRISAVGFGAFGSCVRNSRGAIM